MLTATAWCELTVGGLYGQVVDLGTGQPIEGAQVMAAATGDVQPTDPHGCFAVTDAVARTGESVKVDVFGALLGGPLLAGQSHVAMCTQPRRVLVWADGYRSYEGFCDVVCADATRFAVVAQRLCLAPRGGIALSAPAGLGDAAHVEGIGPGPVVEPVQIAVPAPTPTATLRVRRRAPEMLPLDYQVGALLSTGRRVDLHYAPAAQVDLPADAGVVEIVTAATLPSYAGMTHVHRSPRSFLGRHGTASWSSAQPVTLPSKAPDDTSDEGLSAAVHYLVLMPDCTATEAEAADWAELCLWREQLNRGDLEWDAARARITGLPEGPQRLVFEGALCLARALDEGDLPAGIAGLHELLPAANDNVPSLLLRDDALACARVALDSNDAGLRTNALGALQQAAERLWEYGPGLRQLADAAHELGDLPLAARLYDRAADRLSPLDGEATMTASFIYRCRAPWADQPAARLGEALGLLLRAQAEGSADHWLAAAEALRACGLHSRAMEAARRVAELEPGRAAAWLILGDELRDLGQLEEATDAYKSAARSAPRCARAWYAMGTTYWSTGRRERAARDLARASELAPDEPVYQRAALLAETYLEAQSDTGAVERAALMFLLDPHGALPDEPRTAWGLAEQDLTANDTPWLHWVRACLQPDAALAVAQLKTARALSPGEAFFASEIASLLFREDGPAQAAQAARVALVVDLKDLALPHGLPPEDADELRRLRDRSLSTARAILATDHEAPSGAM